MGYTIAVDLDQLTKTADRIEEHLNKVRTMMTNCGDQMQKSSEYWEGEERDRFLERWTQLLTGETAVRIYPDAMQRIAQYLRDCAYEYKRGQTEAISRANKLRF